MEGTFHWRTLTTSQDTESLCCAQKHYFNEKIKQLLDTGSMRTKKEDRSKETRPREEHTI